MDYSFIIRKAQPCDAKAIQGIIEEAFEKYIKDTGFSGTMEALGESVKDIKNDIESKEVFIAMIDDLPVGTIRIQISPDNTAYISRFGVRPQYHDMGIGRSMMLLVDKLLISSGVKKVSLHTASKYRELMRFYYGGNFYVDSTTKDRGYVRALMVKYYD
ncbi:MAG: GNAT family N-acetyltransferase [Clostridium sp.]|nr:GNAT family N-acetyltransferase [Clostridium sp.]